MSITEKNTGNNVELTTAGNHIARCYSMIEIGTVKEDFKGELTPAGNHIALYDTRRNIPQSKATREAANACRVD